MKPLILILVLAGINGWSGASNCCMISQWGRNHMVVVKLLAEHFKHVYGAAAHRTPVENTYQIWSENFANSIEKNKDEVNAVIKKTSDDIFNDMRDAQLTYGQVARPNYFEARAAEVLEKLAKDLKNVDTQTDQNIILEPYVPESVWAKEHVDVIKSIAGKLMLAYTAATLGKEINNSNEKWSENFVNSIGKSSDEVNALIQKMLDEIVDGVHASRVTFVQVSKPNYFENKVAAVFQKLVGCSKNVGTQQEDHIRKFDVPQDVTKMIDDINHYNKSTKVKTASDQTITTENKYKPKAITELHGGPVVSGSQREPVHPPPTRNDGTLKKENLNAWQNSEKELVLHLAQNQSQFSLMEFEEKFIADRRQEGWVFKESKRQIKPEALTSWQINEKNWLENLIRDEDLSLEQLESTIKNERARLIQVALLNDVIIEEIEEYIRWEGKRLIKPVPLTAWQVDEHERILQQIGQLQSLTFEGLENQIRSQRYRLQQIAQQYHITVEEIEEWIRKEGKLLIKPVHHTSTAQASPWQQHEREHLLAFIRNKHITKKTNFEDRLSADNMRISNVAPHYQVTVEEVEDFLRKEYQSLLQQNLVSDGEGTVEVVNWQGDEQKRIELLLQQHTWSIEELERELAKNRERLQQLANQYHVTLEEIEEWYRSELQKLLQQNKLQSENLTDWQKREKDRLYTTVVHQQISIEELERQLKNDRDYLKRLAAQYRITIDQLINWQRNEIERLANLGYGKPIESASLKSWQTVERKRLRIIPDKIIITREELLEFIKSDRLFQNNLTANYEIFPQELFNFQSKELQVMQNEGLLEILKLKHLEDWQRRERDRLYSLIRTNSFSSKNLPGWQTDEKTTRIAATYNLPAYILRNWQKQEIERIENVAEHYKMSLNVLEDFRYRELERLQMISHKDYLAEAAYNSWSNREDMRMRALMTRTGLSGAQLDKWRRKLYLLAQGLLDLSISEVGYREIVLNTSSSDFARFNKTISSDRGDKKPAWSAPYSPPTAYYPTRKDTSQHGYGSGNPLTAVGDSVSSHHSGVGNYRQAFGNRFTHEIHQSYEYEYSSIDSRIDQNSEKFKNFDQQQIDRFVSKSLSVLQLGLKKMERQIKKSFSKLETAKSWLGEILL